MVEVLYAIFLQRMRWTWALLRCIPNFCGLTLYLSHSRQSQHRIIGCGNVQQKSAYQQVCFAIWLSAPQNKQSRRSTPVMQGRFLFDCALRGFRTVTGRTEFHIEKPLDWWLFGFPPLFFFRQPQGYPNGGNFAGFAFSSQIELRPN